MKKYMYNEIHNVLYFYQVLCEVKITALTLEVSSYGGRKVGKFPFYKLILIIANSEVGRMSYSYYKLHSKVVTLNSS